MSSKIKRPKPEDYGLSEEKYLELSSLLEKKKKSNTLYKVGLVAVYGFAVGGVGVESQHYMNPLFLSLLAALGVYLRADEKADDERFDRERQSVIGFEDYPAYRAFEAAREYYDALSNLKH